MAGFGEPWEWTTDRNQRMESEYPELANTSADDVLGTDNYAVSQGRAPTQFSSTAMGLGAHSVVPKETEDNSWWGAIKRAGSSILALDTPISERLGYKVPEGSGPADELANFALEEATRPSNIAFSAIGALLSASGVGAPVGAPILAGTAARIAGGATARAAARGAAKNITIGVGGRVAATGVEKVAEYAPEEIGPLAALASAGAGLYATRGRSGLTRGAAALAAGGVGYASPELAGGIAGGVLTSKAIGGFSSWKEAANSIESRAATQAETQAAQLLEQAEVSKQRMRDLAAAERRGETRISSDRMPETPMGQEWENNLLGQVAYKTGGTDADGKRFVILSDGQRFYESDVPPEVTAFMRENYPSRSPKTTVNSRAAMRTAPERGMKYASDPELPAAQAAAPERITIKLSPVSADSPAAVFLDRIKATGIPSGFGLDNPSGSGRIVESGSARAQLHAVKNQVVNIDRLQLTARGKPEDTFKLLRQITQNADTTGVTLTLDAVPYETATAGKTTPEKLKSLYARYGFTPSDAEGISLIRQPKLPAPAARAAEPAGRTAGSVPAAEEVNPYLAKMRTQPGEPGYAKALQRAESRWKAQQTIRAAANPAVEPPIARVETPVDWIPQLRSTGGEINADGTVTVFHTTTRKNAEKIIKDGVLRGSRKDDGVWVSTSPDAARDYAKWGDDSVTVQMNIKASDLTPDLDRFNSMNQMPGQNRLDMSAKTKNGSYKPASIGDIREIDVAPAAAQQVDTPVTPAAAGGGEVPPPPPRETATGGAPEFKGTPQSSRSFPTWEDSATHNRISAELAPVIEERLGQAAKTTALKTSENNKIKDIANRQAEKVREAAISEGKTESQANALYEEEWRKAYSGERTKSKLDLPLTISDLTDARIRDSFARVRREVPGDTYLINKIFEATRALDAITGKTQGAKKSELESFKFWVNLMSPEEESRYLENQFRNYGGFNRNNAKLLETKDKLLKAKPAFGADDIADGVPAGNQAGRVATDEAAAPRQTGEPTARPVDEPTARPVDESINRPIDELTGEPVAEPTVAPDGQTMDGAGSTAGEAEIPGATGGGGKGRGKGAGKGGGDEGGGASSTGDDIEGVPEANDYGKSFRKSEQEIKDAKGVNTFWNILTDVLAAPRSLKASFDLSGAGRQAAPYGYSHPGQALKAFKAQLKAYGSEAGYQESVERLANKPWADIRNEVVANSLVDQPLLNGERTFISKGLNKIRGFRASERAYATYLNELRDSAFEMMWRNSGLSLEELTSVANVPKVKAWGDLINAATGHGDIGALFNAKVAGNPILWAPNFLYSRVKLPWIALTQWHKNPEVAREAATQLVVFAGVNGALLAGVNASGAASVELDPRSSDFGQMRIGNSRIDPWAGYRPIVNLVARLQSGETKSTTTGDISDPTNLKIVQDFLRNKMEPLSGEILNQILGSNSIGEPTAADTNMAIRLVAPLFLESMVRAINVGGPSVTPSENFSDQIASFGRNVTSTGGLKAAALTLPGFVGVGTATYEPLIKKMDRATLDRMSPQERNNFQTGEQRGLANLTPAEQQKVIPALAFRRMYESIPSMSGEVSNYGSFSGFKRDKIREYAEINMGYGISKANAVLRAEQQFQNSGYQEIYQRNVNYLKYQWSQAHPGELAEEIEETYKINPRDRTFRPNAMQKAMAEPYLQKR